MQSCLLAMGKVVVGIIVFFGGGNDVCDAEILLGCVMVEKLLFCLVWYW